MAPAVEPFPDALDRSLLHLFVFGADVGEAIAVALPDRGWILIDGCKIDIGDSEHFPALDAYTALRSGPDDPVELLVWTHPHSDHYQGIREAIALHQPARVGMTLVETPPPGSASREVEAIGSHPMLPADLRIRDVFNQVKSTVERIFHYWRHRPDACLPLSAQTAPLTLGRTRVCPFTPDEEALREFYAQGVDGLRSALRERANEYSIVLGLEFGACRLVLGGDLPYCAPGGAVVPHGWSALRERAPQLAAHAAFKVAHHGSAEAIPPQFLGHGTAREWIVTPYSRHRLPHPGDDARGGLRQLLRGVAAVRLTSAVGLVDPSQPGAEVPRRQLRELLAEVEGGGWSRGLRAPAATGPFDFAWGVALDPDGSARRLFAGRQAITVVETD